MDLNDKIKRIAAEVMNDQVSSKKEFKEWLDKRVDNGLEEGQKALNERP